MIEEGPDGVELVLGGVWYSNPSSQVQGSTIVPFPFTSGLFEQWQSLSLMLATKAFSSSISPRASSNSPR